MNNIEQIKNIVNLKNVNNNVELFIKTFNVLNNTEHTTLDSIIDEMKNNALAQLMNNNVNTRSTMNDEERRLKRNESSRRSHEKRRNELKRVEAELNTLKSQLN